MIVRAFQSPGAMQCDGLVTPVFDLEALLHSRRRWTRRRTIGDVNDVVVIANDGKVLQDGREPVLGIGSFESMLDTFGRAGSELVRRENLRTG